MPASWNSAGDWDVAQSESGVVHENVSGTDHNKEYIVKPGYQIQNPYLESSRNMEVYYPMHDSSAPVTDFGPNGINASENYTVYYDQTGLLGTTCVQTDNGHLEFSAATNESSVTMLTWFNYQSFDSYGRVFDVQPGDSAGGWAIEFDSSNSALYLNGGNLGNPISVSSNTWYYVVARFGADQELFIYDINGNLVGSDLKNDNNRNTGGTYTNYISRGDGNRTFAKYLDFRLYKDALTDSEIQTLLNVVATQGSITSDKQSL